MMMQMERTVLSKNKKLETNRFLAKAPSAVRLKLVLELGTLNMKYFDL